MKLQSKVNKPWIERIERDLAPFADPTASGTRVTWMESGATIVAQWEARGDRLEAAFSVTTEGIERVTFANTSQSYLGFLASHQMGDLGMLAKMMISFYGESDQFVPTEARLDDSTPQGPATDLVQGLLTRPVEGELTRVVFVTGDAGAGKTRILKKLMRAQALGFQAGRNSCLYFYVDAQGRSLASLDEALAIELDNLRSRLTYGMLPTLVRNGLLVPIIDGFDELLGSSYDDAFSSLSRFLEQLDGLGQIVACSRSTYYEQEFFSRASSRASDLGTQTWAAERVQLVGWGPKEVDLFLDFKCEELGLKGESAIQGKRRVREVIGRGASMGLQERPFFLTRIASLVLEGRDQLEGKDVLGVLVRVYLERECKEKLLHKETRKPLLTTEQLANLLTQVAQEMWLQETRELDVKIIREIVDVVAGEVVLQAKVHEYIHQRGPMLGFLSSQGPRRVDFEHELFFSYFLARSFADEIYQGSKRLSWLLPRSAFPPQAADIVAAMLQRQSVDLVRAVAQICASIDVNSFRAEQMRENAGALVAAIIRVVAGQASTGIVGDSKFSNITFAGDSFENVRFQNCEFNNVIFQRTNLTKTTFENCRCRASIFRGIAVDPEHTKLGLLGVDITNDIVGLQLGADGQMEYAPGNIIGTLARCGLPGALEQNAILRSVNQEVIDLVDRLVKAYNRSNIVWPEDDGMRWWATNLYSERIKQLLLKWNVVSLGDSEQKRKQRESLRRNFLPTQIMAGANPLAEVPPAVRGFWDDVEREFPGNP